MKKAIMGHDIEKLYDVVINQVTLSPYKNRILVPGFGGFLKDECEEKDLVPLHPQRSTITDG